VLSRVQSVKRGLTEGSLASCLGTGRRRADARGGSAHARDDAPNFAHKTGAAEEFYFISNLPIDLRASLKKFRVLGDFFF
jgi:hypothetical protein